MKIKLLVFFLAISLAFSFTPPYYQQIPLPNTYTYKTVGNVSIELDVYVPSASNYAKFPVLFEIHGGGYIMGGKASGSTPAELEEALGRGWVVVSINYRLSPGVLLSDIVSDIQDAYAWVRTKLVSKVNIDPDNIIIFGGSAGGGATVISGFKLSPKPKALFAFYPYCTDFTNGFAYNPLTPLNQTLVEEAQKLETPILTKYWPSGNDDPYGTLARSLIHQHMGGWLLATHDPNASPKSIEATLANYSAVLNIDADYPPTYLCHGLNDILVPYSQTVEMGAALRLKNISHMVALVPGVGHGWDYAATADQYKTYIEPGFEFVAQYITTPAKGAESYEEELFLSQRTEV